MDSYIFLNQKKRSSHKILSKSEKKLAYIFFCKIVFGTV